MDRRESYRLNKDIFLRRSREVHSDKYDYSYVNYINQRTKVDIVCPTHGIFSQTPKNHMKGQGCPECGSQYAKNYHKRQYVQTSPNGGCQHCFFTQSSGEKDIASFVKEICGEDTIYLNDRSLLNGYELDIYLPSHKTAIEYNRLYCHCDDIDILPPLK